MVELVKGLEEQEYYHGFIRREDAVTILKNTGEYLIRCELVQGAASTMTPGAVNSTCRYLLCVLVETEPGKKTVAEWELKTTENKWHIETVADRKLHFTTVAQLIEHYSNSNNQVILPRTDVTDLVKSGMVPVEQQSKTVQRILLTKCVKKPKWEIKATDVIYSTGPESLLGTGNYGCVRRAALRLNGKEVPVAIKIVEDKKKLASRKSTKGSLKGSVKGGVGSQKNSLKMPGSDKRQSGKQKRSARKPPTPTDQQPSAEPTPAYEQISSGKEKAPTSPKEKVPSKKGAERPQMELIIDTLKEAAAMRDLNHPNVVKLYGVVVEKPPIMMIIEIVNMGSLDKYLAEKWSSIQLTVEEMNHLAVQAAWGVEYLHSKQIIHRDIAARNCLLNSMDNGKTIVLKISDFGLSKIGSSYTIRKAGNIGLPIKVMSPESLSNLSFSSASDVWSFGFLIYEIYSHGKMPLANGNPPWNRNTLMIHYGKSLPCPQAIPKDFPEKAVDIMNGCWRLSTTDRYSMTEIAMILEEITGLQPSVIPNRREALERKKILDGLKPSKEPATKGTKEEMKPSKEESAARKKTKTKERNSIKRKAKKDKTASRKIVNHKRSK